MNFCFFIYFRHILLKVVQKRTTFGVKKGVSERTFARSENAKFSSQKKEWSDVT
ncbi:hypothetical protein CUS_7598 [Ruminococcus albus 8]|uniref:Uncharacterized protein n=1 Tax=Ruminococcus albus 8 TaxID=246199 RepID=E9SH70_RUMAL|nr:hypothetical protein CUS_7598 [Ruminococcus albus 8]